MQLYSLAVRLEVDCSWTFDCLYDYDVRDASQATVIHAVCRVGPLVGRGLLNKP